MYRVDPARSVVVITVRRGGSLARFGHDHVVASHGVQGFVAPDAGRADLFVPLTELTVDEPALRAQAGFDTQPGEADIAGTRDNMHAMVLETQRFPFALIRIDTVDKMESRATLDVAITLHGVQRNLVVPVMLEISPGEVSASGLIEFNQSDFGIAPFSILGGAVQVQDRLSLRFAVRASSPPE
ncbi:YceI family protein [Variovorax humicola]|uniref:YceI family protein n=1 Tax=Variovorax humicola TaxID=1769758 RepID=A0ABU8VV90_9BURK